MSLKVKRERQRFYFRRPEVIKSTDQVKKEKKKINTKPLKSIFYLILLMLVLYFAIFSDFFKIKTVSIDGVKSVEILDHLNKTLIGRNILLMRTGHYLNDLSKTFPILEEASIVRGLPSTVKISVKERSQVMILCSGSGGCFEIDSNGYAYQKIQRPTDKVVLVDEKNFAIKETDQVFSKSFIKFFLDAIDELNKNSITIKEARMDETSFKIRFITSEGWAAVLDSSSNLQNQISAVKQAVDKNKSDIHEYVDVRVEGVAYLK